MNSQPTQEYLSPIIVIRRRFIATIGILCILAGSIFSVLGFYITDMRFMIYINIGVIILGIIIVVLHRFPRLFTFVSYLCVIGISVFSLLLVYDNPKNHVFYALLIPILIIFITGKTVGAIVSMLYGAVLLVLLQTFDYTSYALLQVGSAFTYSTIIMYVYQNILDTSNQLVHKQNEELQKTVGQLEEEVHMRKEAEAKLHEDMGVMQAQKEELEKLFKSTVEREVRMSQIKLENEALKTKTEEAS